MIIIHSFIHSSIQYMLANILHVDIQFSIQLVLRVSITKPYVRDELIISAISYSCSIFVKTFFKKANQLANDITQFQLFVCMKYYMLIVFFLFIICQLIMRNCIDNFIYPKHFKQSLSKFLFTLCYISLQKCINYTSD